MTVFVCDVTLGTDQNDIDASDLVIDTENERRNRHNQDHEPPLQPGDPDYMEPLPKGSMAERTQSVEWCIDNQIMPNAWDSYARQQAVKLAKEAKLAELWDDASENGRVAATTALEQS